MDGQYQTAGVAMMACLQTWLEQAARHRAMAAVVFAASILTAVLFWQLLPAGWASAGVTDTTHYYEPVARNLLHGRGLYASDGQIATRYPPGYSLLLAGVFGLAHALHIPEATALAGFSLLCMGAASTVLFALARRVWGPLAGLLAAGLWMTYPVALWVSAQPQSEIPFLPILYGSLFCCWWALESTRGHWAAYLAAGVLWGVAMLIRPAAIGLGAVMAVSAIGMGRERPVRLRLARALAILLGGLLVILPWETWVYARSGDVIVLSTGSVPSIRDGLTFAVHERKQRAPVSVPPEAERVQQAILARYDELQTPGDIASVLAEQARERPLGVLALYAVKLARSWYGTDSQRYDSLILLVQIPYLLLILAGSYAAWRQGGQARRWAMVAWLVACSFWVMSVLALSILRYMLPAMGPLLTLIPGMLVRPARDGRA